MFQSRRGAIILAVPVLLWACAEADSADNSTAGAGSALVPPDAPSSAHVVDVAGMDYSFEAPVAIDAGWTTFRFANRGAEAHHLTLVRLEDGHSVDDLVAALREHRPLTGIASFAGGPNAPMPGASSNATVNLPPGEYALICLVPSPDGVPHLFKGMVKPITVREGAEAGVEPAADLEISMRDFAFLVDGQISPGERTIRAVNASAAGEPHEIVVARLAPGKTAKDVNDWMHSMQGPPPAEFLGGIAALGPGQSGYFTVDFTPGEYAILCPMPAADGQPHTYKGMMQQFTVM